MKKPGTKIIVTILLCCVILGGVIGAIIALGVQDDEPTPKVKVYEVGTTQPRDDGPTEPKRPKLLRIRDEETAQSVSIVTSYCTLSHPIAFRDVIEAVVVHHDDRSAIDFSARLNGDHYPLYSIDFSGEGDILLGTLNLENVICEVRGKKYAESPELSGNDLVTFRDALNTFENICASLEADAAFTPAQTNDSLYLIKSEETAESVNIVTSFCTLSHPYAFSDLIEHVIVATNTRTAIDFYARLNGGHCPLYSIDFSGEGSILLGTLNVNGKSYEVRATIHEEDGTLPEDDIISYQAARETFNDVWESLTANDGFTPAQ